ncbi:MAG: hypothetical protein JW834_01105 [Candidatus Diapherotrites archaeon]|nr:hypothetical protein [Candidatus Diapherotrites archaeon]
MQNNKTHPLMKGLRPHEKAALKTVGNKVKELKVETQEETTERALQLARARHLKEDTEDTLGLSSGQKDQGWIDKSTALRQKISKTIFRTRKTPP